MQFDRKRAAQAFLRRKADRIMPNGSGKECIFLQQLPPIYIGRHKVLVSDRQCYNLLDH
jgi:hypothetical protein